jgi:hypothetical protein
MAINSEISSDTKITDHAPAGAAALAREYAQSVGPSDLSVGERSKIMLGAAAEGTLSHATDEIINHPGRTTSQVLGAAALGLALRGPAWTRLPALAVAAVGTVSYAHSLAEAESSAASTFSGLNSHNIEKSREEFKASLSPVIFDTALMVGAGAATSHLAARLPLEAPKVEMATTVALAREHLSNLLGGGGFPPGMTPALAGAEGMGLGGALRGGKMFNTASEGRPQRLTDFLNAGKAPEAQVMAMTSHGNGGGARVGGDGIQVKASRGVNGETFYTIDNLPAGRTVNVSHDGGAVTSVASDGKVMVGFNSGEGRQLDLGQQISR